MKGHLLRIGLTGGIGSGKSTVAALMEMLGGAVYSADIRAKELMASDGALKCDIQVLFGREAYLENGTLNRSYLAERIFRHPDLRKKLNGLVHPAVAKDFDRWAAEQEQIEAGNIHRPAYLVEEAAILIESGAAQKMDRIVVVTAPEELRIARVMKRDQTDRASAEARIRAQISETERLKHADHVLIADDKELLIPQVVKLHKELCGAF